MNKNHIIKILTESAKKYEQNLLNKNIMFVFKDNNNKKLHFIETLFNKENFLHLTGIKYAKSANDFFYNCLNNTLALKDIEIKNNIYTKLKLDVLENAMYIHKSAKEIGNYNNNGFELNLEKIIGGVHYCIGFSNLKKDGNKIKFYYPKSLLKIDIRYYATTNQKIVAIFSKNKNIKNYTEITYLSKDISIYDIFNSENIKNKIDYINFQTPNLYIS